MIGLSAFVAGSGKVKDIAERLGILEKLKSRWANQPAAARDQLAQCLGHVQDFYETVESTVGELFAIDLRRPLLKVEVDLDRVTTPRLKVRLEDARFHCTEILRVYHDLLRGWFSAETGLLSDADRHELNELFVYDLGDSDAWMMAKIKDLVESLADLAEQLRTLVGRGAIDDAERLLADAYREAKDAREEIGNLMLKLRQTQSTIRDFRNV
jgi:hypothetical protein